MSVSRIELSRNRGVTLVELLIGVAVGGIVTLAVIAAWGLSVRSASYALESARLNNDLRSAMQVISQDLRRADGGVDIPEDRTVRFAGGPCITYFVEGLPRGFRFRNGLFEMYFKDDPPFSPATCDPDPSWFALYEGLAEGEFRITGFTANWQAVCYPFDETATVVQTDSTSAGGIDVFPRCVEGGSEMTDVTEVLEVTLALTGEIGTGSGTKVMTVEDTVTVRNNYVR